MSFIAPSGIQETDQKVKELLSVLSSHMKMDMAGLSIWQDSSLVTQVVAGDGASFGISPGVTFGIDKSFFRDLQTGLVTAITGEARRDPRAAPRDVIRSSNIESYAMTSLADAEGKPYGILYCLSHRTMPGLAQREGRFLSLMASFLKDYLLDLRKLWELRSGISRCISDLIDSGGPRIVYQPVVRLTTGETVAVEALSRFPPSCFGHALDTEGWFAEARTVNLHVDLETLIAQQAIKAFSSLPPTVKIAINASPDTVSERLPQLVCDLPERDRLIIELTEHERWTETPAALRGVERLRSRGIRIAVDDAGTGYSGLEQLIQLRPHLIKIDHALTGGIDRDPVRCALAMGIARLADAINASVIAEGIETPQERDTIAMIGITFGQGYLLGKPDSLAVRSALRGTAPATHHGPAPSTTRSECPLRPQPTPGSPDAPGSAPCST